MHAPFSRVGAACHRMGLEPSITFKIPQKCAQNTVGFIILRRSWRWHSTQATASSSAPPALLTMPSLMQGEVSGNLYVCRSSVSLWTPAAPLYNDNLLNQQHRSTFFTRWLIKLKPELHRSKVFTMSGDSKRLNACAFA